MSHCHVTARERFAIEQLLLFGLSCRETGRHVQIGQPLGEHANTPIPLRETVYYRQLVIMGSRGLPALRFPALFEMIAAGSLDVRKLIKNRIALERATAILRQMDRHEDVGISLIDRFWPPCRLANRLPSGRERGRPRETRGRREGRR